jgi:hypothetical protein
MAMRAPWAMSVSDMSITRSAMSGSVTLKVMTLKRALDHSLEMVWSK